MSGRLALFRWNRTLSDLPGFPGDLAPHWNQSPGNRLLMLRQVDGELRADLARWGLTPAWLKDLSRTPAHARSETLAEQPMFREAFAQRRCLVPVNGFYEWRGVRKRPFWLAAEQGLLHLAGLWEAYPVEGQTWLSLALVTRAAANLRRPVPLDEDGQALWLAEDTPAERLRLLLLKPSATLRERPLATLVNDPRLDDPACLTPA